ncbi:hypothetical protein VTK73DRAFT_6307 [Phialemonium thermophilum]|uniref:Uncharacterized protein n=1 Tax=Phialemonium thermophilum TaxID=223376 RepID=A0ABR3WJW4_9PEZI
MVRELLLHPQFAQTDEVLAACIILSTYEMIDVAGENLGSHLRGVASLLQSRQVQGDMRGIRGAAYWTWYRHEIWAALQTGRRISLNESYWEPQPVGPLGHLEIEDVANRVLFIMGQCIDFSNGHGVGEEDLGPNELLRSRHTRAVQLELALEEWYSSRPPSMACFRTEQTKLDQPRDETAGGFPTIWFVFPQSAIAHQVYHASKIILALYQPGILHTPQGLAKCASLSVA